MKIGPKRKRELAAIDAEMVAIINKTPFNGNFLDNPRYQVLNRRRDKMLGIEPMKRTYRF